jgi:hypothetical protein
MEHLTWSASEKRVARNVFESALQAELAEILIEFKRRAAAIKSPEEMWSLRKYLETSQREVETKYDYRYSELIFVFGRLLRENRIQAEQLQGLDEVKMEYIHRIVNL